MPEVPDTVDDAIEPLISPSTDEVFEATRSFSAREIASAAASEALSGGGGGSPSAWINLIGSSAQTDSDPGDPVARGALLFSTIVTQQGTGITWPDPDGGGNNSGVVLVPGWYSLLAHASFDASVDEVADAASIWALGVTFGDGLLDAGFSATSSYFTTNYQKGGTWLHMSYPLFKVSAEAAIQVYWEADHISTDPVCSRTELMIVRVFD